MANQETVKVTRLPQKPIYADLIFRIQNMIPSVHLDALTLAYQIGLIQVLLFTIFMWITMSLTQPYGFDTTVHWWFYQNGWTELGLPMFQGIGIHWSTLFYFSFGTLNLSFFLKKKFHIVGLHNIAYSLIVGFWVAAMVFEIPYVFCMDWFHNAGDPTRFPIWLSGWNVLKIGAVGQVGFDALRWTLVAVILYPITAGISSILAFRKFGSNLIMKYGYRATEKIAYGTFIGVFAASFTATLWFCLNVGIFPVIIRNFGWFLGFVMAYIILIDALQNPYSGKEIIQFTFRFGEKKTWIIFAGFVVGMLLWIFYPYTPLQSISPAAFVKGTELFPQTVYAFYQSDVPIISNQIWIANTGVFALNHLVCKSLATLFAIYGFAPKRKVIKL